MNPSATKFELEHYFEVAKPKLIAVDAALVDNVLHAVRVLDIQPQVIIIDDSDGKLPSSQTVVSGISTGSRCSAHKEVSKRFYAAIGVDSPV